MADLDKIIKDLSSLTVVEAAELSKKLEEEWGVTAAAPVAAAPAAGGVRRRRRRGPGRGGRPSALPRGCVSCSPRVA